MNEEATEPKELTVEELDAIEDLAAKMAEELDFADAEEAAAAKLEAAQKKLEELPEPVVMTRKRGHARLVRRKGQTWVATGVKGRHLQIFHVKDAKRSHYFSALGRKRA